MIPLTTAFETFRKLLDPTEAPADAILDRFKLREHITTTWRPLSAAVVGSYARGTNLRPTRELDYLFVLPPAHQHYVQSDPARFLDDLAARVDMAYPQVRARRVAHGLAMAFGAVTVVLVPATPRHGGGLFLPDTEQRRWLPSDPEAHAAFVRDRARASSQLAVPVARALRCWRRTHGVVVRGFHLEVLALRGIDGSTDFATACADAFERVATGVTVRCPAPVAVGDDVDAYLALKPDVRTRVAAAAGEAAASLRAALALAAGGDDGAACTRTLQVFGAPFPG
jgi:hypothetical protein